VIEQWFSDPSKVGATALLLVAIVAYHKGWVVARWQYDDAEGRCKTEREGRERLLEQLEKIAAASNVLAGKVKQRKA
jgi:hypothetical protein